jgi:hypothetical protein
LEVPYGEGVQSGPIIIFSETSAKGAVPRMRLVRVNFG